MEKTVVPEGKAGAEVEEESEPELTPEDQAIPGEVREAAEESVVSEEEKVESRKASQVETGEETPKVETVQEVLRVETGEAIL